MSKKNKDKKDKNKSSFLTKPLTKRRFKKELQAQTRAQFKPLSRELQKQERISKLQSQRMSRYFEDYQRAIGRARTETQGAYQGAVDTMGSYAQQAGSRNAALQGQLQGQAAQNASLYGGGDTGAANLAVQGEANRVRAGADMAGAIAAQGANTYGYLSSQKANSKLAKVEALQAERANRLSISQDRQDLIRERADFRQQYMADAREGERRYELALKELRNSKNQAHKDRTQARKEARKDREQGRRDNRHANESGNGEGTKPGGENKQDYKKAIALLGGFKDQKQISKNPKAAIAGLVNEGIPAGIARRAVKAYLKKHGGKGKGGGISRDPNGPSLGR